MTTVASTQLVWVLFSRLSSSCQSGQDKRREGSEVSRLVADLLPISKWSNDDADLLKMPSWFRSHNILQGWNRIKFIKFQDPGCCFFHQASVFLVLFTLSKEANTLLFRNNDSGETT